MLPRAVEETLNIIKNSGSVPATPNNGDSFVETHSDEIFSINKRPRYYDHDEVLTNDAVYLRMSIYAIYAE